eukprot:1854525-Pyramimonas_sp.AAC.1
MGTSRMGPLSAGEGEVQGYIPYGMKMDPFPKGKGGWRGGPPAPDAPRKGGLDFSWKLCEITRR